MSRFALTNGQVVEKFKELDSKISEHDDELKKVILEQSQPEEIKKINCNFSINGV